MKHPVISPNQVTIGTVIQYDFIDWDRSVTQRRLTVTGITKKRVAFTEGGQSYERDAKTFFSNVNSLGGSEIVQ